MPFANFPGKFGDISSHFGMIWRFATMADPLVVEWHSRDLDSLPNPREVAAVNDWLRDSNLTFQIMRDHPLHNSKILGGAFGMRISGSNHSYNGQHVTEKLVFISVHSNLTWIKTECFLYRHGKAKSI